MNYHNITPADLLEAWMPEVGEEVRWGRAQLRDLAPITEFAIADSRFNEGELRSAGYRSTTTLPILIDLETFSEAPDPSWPPDWPSRRPEAAPTSSSSGRCRRTRVRTISSSP